ncbi:winged helix-turn-helix domain-containing protein [Kibdelosporangium philippinense]|uniref:Winged helix-turn-helix domain-containing protein n=1 Tax=Kibdelosporangium philippinense TaxID=211113 RepID=A0ABS8ZPR2_9PSEU|nr:AfsR/SARP family transcriptional regulator [Kibdelosporangium philippinense]MCE7009163.1 winged helix-turn-helix domain-containing protein [Kibdelosporangium philippinense]
MSTGETGEDDHAVVRFGVLGPVQAVVNGEPVALGGPGVRGLLAMLLLRPNEVVPVEDILDGLWGDDPPLTARTIVQNYVSRLRRQLRLVDPTGSVWIDTQLPGYQLIVDEDLIDVSRATWLLNRARHDHPVRRAEMLREALSLWRGPVLADVSPRINAPELEDLRFAVLEARIEADLELGRHAELIGELATFAEAYPFREQMIAHLMLALYRTGRRADALESYQRFARRAAEDLGIDPGPALRELHERVLNDDSTLLLPVPAPLVPPKVGVIVPAQLPPAPVGFHGRDEELVWLDQLLAEDHGAATPIGVISGPAGIGKTALAALWGRMVDHEFPDGQLFVSLRGFHPEYAPLEPGDVLTQFLLTLGVPANEVPVDTDDRAALYRSLLAHRRVLVMLDDARDSAQVRLLLPGGSRALVLITSRVRLEGMVARSGAWLLDLEALPVPDSIRVIDTIVGAGRIDHARLEQLATLCGGWPQALRIVGARLAARQEWVADELISEIGDQRTRLAALTAEHSDTSVRAGFDLTYRRLAEPDSFRLLGLFPGPSISPAAMAAMQSVDVAEARRNLRVLADAFLVTETNRDVFVMHDLIRLHAKELAPVGEERSAAYDRLVLYYLSSADATRRFFGPAAYPLGKSDNSGFGDAAQAVAWFEREWPTLLALLDVAAPSDAWRLARMAHDFWVVSPSRASLVHKGLSIAVSAGDLEGEAWLRAARCSLEYSKETVSDAARVIEIANSLSDTRLAAVGYEALATVQNGVAGYEKALEYYGELGEPALSGPAHARLALLQAEMGNYGTAERHARTAVDVSNTVFAEASGREALGRVLSMRGANSAAQQQWQQAAELYAQVSVERAEQMRDLIDGV